MKSSRVLILALLSIAAPLRADDMTGILSAGGELGGGVPLGTAWVVNNADPGVVLGGFVRYGMNKNLSLGLSYDNLGFNDRGIRVQSFLANGYYSLKPDSLWNPNIHIGLGGSDVNRDEIDRHTAVTTKLGLGADYFVHRDVSVGGFLDYLVAWNMSGTNHEVHSLLFGLTLAYWFMPCNCACSSR